MRFDNAQSGSHFEKRLRAKSNLCYAAVASLVSVCWFVDLAFAPGPSPFAGRDPNGIAAWLPFAPGIILAGVLVAFVFRSHMAGATFWQGAFSAIGIGLIGSLIAAAIPFGITFIGGPIVFAQNWMITLPMSWFSFWIMRRTSRAWNLRFGGLNA
jgi:hypothetical protein